MMHSRPALLTSSLNVKWSQYNFWYTRTDICAHSVSVVQEEEVDVYANWIDANTKENEADGGQNGDA